jgi:hypothetical protein
MKNAFLFPLAIILFFYSQVTAQITLEKEYQEVAEFAYLEGDYYYSIDYINNQSSIYNLDHSLKKTVDIDVPTDWYLNDGAYVSTKMFNNDDLLEMLVVYYKYVLITDTTGYYEYMIKVVNENGTELLNVPGGGYSYVFTTGTGKTKLMIYVYDYSVDPATYQTNIYSIPGQVSSVQNQGEVMKIPDPFPNPTKDIITIPYQLNQAGAEGTIMVTDMEGHKIKILSVKGRKGQIILNTGNLAPGQYLYTLQSKGQTTTTKKFIVN